MGAVIDNIDQDSSALLAQVAGITRIVRVVRVERANRLIGVLENGVLESGGRA